jgi:general secretion pathway protein A
VDEQKTTVLIIDEGQKIPAFCLEILREFLNYETNEYKLLQIVIFAQMEFENKIRKYANFADRISLYHTLKPLSFYDTRLMIKYRLEKSSNSRKKLNLFTYPGLWAIYRFTGGYPRKIINLCHQSILSMIIQNRTKSGYFLVSTCARRVFPDESRLIRTIRTAALAIGAAAIILLILLPSGRLKIMTSQGITTIKSLFSQSSDDRTGSRHPKAEVETFRAQIAPSEFQRNNSIDSDTQHMPPADAGERTAKEKPIKTGVSATDGKQLKMEKKATAAVADAATDAQDTDANSLSGSDYPKIMGQIVVQRYENLSGIIQGVYGGFKSAYLEAVISANPDIENPDRVEIGQIISLPTIPAEVTPEGEPAWWIKVGEAETLETAYNMLRNHTESPNTMRLIPYWTPAGGTKFVVVLDRLFRSEASARSRVAQLPLELASKSVILSLWDREAIYFADPYSRRNY